MSNPRCQPTRLAKAVQAPVTIDSLRWAQRADNLQFTELDGVRAVAQNWRTGLAGLTSLLSVTSIVVAPGVGDRLSSAYRPIAGGLALAGLLVLLYGTWKAMQAAFGVPGQAVRVSGESLRQWESASATKGALALRRARYATVAGLVLLVATTAVVIFAASEPPTGALVRVDAGLGMFCGHIGHGDVGKLEIIGSDGAVHLLPITDVKSVQATSSC